MKQWLRVLVCLSLVTALCLPVGCVRADKAKTGVTILFASEMNTFDPPYFTSSNEQTVLYHVFDTLINRDTDGKYWPGLAVSWEQLSDTEWEFKLRQNVKFHNGDPFTAEDVKYTIDRILDPAEQCIGLSKIATIDRVDIVDHYTVRFVTKVPDPILMNRLASLVTWIVPAKHVQTVGKEEFARKPVGTGPYTFVEWVRDDHLTLKRFDDFWGPKAKYETITIKPVGESSTRLAMLQTGEADVIQYVPPDRIDELEKDEDLTVVKTPSLRHMYTILRSDMEPTSNVKLRQAINYAIDKQAIIDHMLSGAGIIAKGQTLGPEYFGYHPGLDPYPYDPDKAARLVKEAGYPNGVDIEMATPNGRWINDKAISEVIVDQLEKVGIRVTLQVVDFAVYSAMRVEKTGPPMILGAWAQPVWDADGVVYLQYKTGEVWGVSYSNPEVDQLAEEARSIVDQDRRLQLYHRALEIIRDEAPVLFMYQMVDVYGIRNGVEVFPQADEMIMTLKKW